MVLALVKRLVDLMKEYLAKNPDGYKYSPLDKKKVRALCDVMSLNGYRAIADDVLQILKNYDDVWDEILKFYAGRTPTPEEIRRELVPKIVEKHMSVLNEIERKLKEMNVEVKQTDGCYYTNYDSSKSIEYCKKFGSDDVISMRYIAYACGLDNCLILQDKHYPDRFIIVYSRGNNTIVYNQLYGTSLFGLVDEYLRSRGCEYNSGLMYTCKGRMDLDELRAVLRFGLMMEKIDPSEMERKVQEIKIKEFESLLVR